MRVGALGSCGSCANANADRVIMPPREWHTNDSRPSVRPPLSDGDDVKMVAGDGDGGSEKAMNTPALIADETVHFVC
jgi:hypothetical protein